MKKGPARKLPRLICTIAFPIPNISLANRRPYFDFVSFSLPTRCCAVRRRLLSLPLPLPALLLLLSFIYLFHPFYGITIGRGARHGPIKLQNNFGRLRRFRVPARGCMREDCAGSEQCFNCLRLQHDLRIPISRFSRVSYLAASFSLQQQF